MAGETYLTISGNLTAAPKSGTSRTGTPWTKLRVASTSRVYDKAENQWRDGDTIFLDVMCWRRLAENALASLERGDRVIVAGRLKQRTYEDEQGVRHTVDQVEADSVGPDLGRAPARLVRSSGEVTLAVVTSEREPEPALS